MAGFETIVRPVVLPNIRPTPKQSIRPQEGSTDDPEKGVCVIRGASAQIVQLPYSFSINTTRSQQDEKERYVDKARVSQKEDDGTVNRDNFIDVDAVNKMRVKGGKKANFGGGASRGDRIVTYYKRLEEADNIEIREKDVQQINQEGNE